MSKAVIILFVTSVGLGLLSLHLVNRMRAGQARIDDLQAQITNLEREKQTPAPAPAPELPPSVEPSPPPVATPSNEAVTAKRPAPPPTAAVAFAAGPAREDQVRMFREAHDRQRQLMQDPDYREAMRIQQRSHIGRHYPGVAQELGLTPEQTEQLFDLLTEHQMRAHQQSQLTWDNDGLDPATLQQRQEKMQQQWQEDQRRNDAELAAQLGSDKLQAWKEYQSSLGSRHQAEQLRNTLASRGVPLDDEAGRAVVKAFAEAHKAEMQEYANLARTGAAAKAARGNVVTWTQSGPSPEMLEKQLEHTQKRQQRVLDALSPYLTYEQREALQKEQEAELKMQEAQIRIMRAQSKFNNAGGTGSSAQAVIVPDQP